MTTNAHPSMFTATEKFRSTAIVAGYSIPALVRMTAREQATLALSQVHSDADGHLYRAWRRIGSAIQIAQYIPAVLLFLVFLASPNFIVLAALLGAIALETAVQRVRLRAIRRTLAMRAHPAGKGRA